MARKRDKPEEIVPFPAWTVPSLWTPPGAHGERCSGCARSGSTSSRVGGGCGRIMAECNATRVGAGRSLGFRGAVVKVCPMVAARTLYEFGRIRSGGMPFLDCDVAELWGRARNGTYAILAIRLLSADPTLNKAQLWLGIQDEVRWETGDEPAASNQGGPTLTFKALAPGVDCRGGAVRGDRREARQRRRASSTARRGREDGAEGVARCFSFRGKVAAG